VWGLLAAPDGAVGGWQWFAGIAASASSIHCAIKKLAL